MSETAVQAKVERRAEARAGRRHDLLEATIRAIARHGPALSMDQIAGEAGITKPILYRHFGDKSGLVRALTHHYLAELRAALAPVTEPDLRRATLERFELGLAFLEQRPGLLEFIERERGFALAERKQGEHAEGLLAQVETLLAGVGLDPALAQPYAHGIGAMILMSVLAWLREPLLSREEFSRAITGLLFDGIEGTLQPSARRGAP